MEAEWSSLESVKHLLVQPDDLCWWCRSRPATTGEHKFKASDLARLMGDDSLVWGDTAGNAREIRGRGGIQRDRHGVVKFPKSFCDSCNNATSQPFDRTYDRFSDYLASHRNLDAKDGIDFVRVFGPDWRESLFNLARYYGKHFGCQLVRTGVGAPDSLRSFLDGEFDMPDVHMALVTTDVVQKTVFRRGLTISPGAVFADPEFTEIRSCVFAAYVGAVGVRFEWREAGIPDDERSQFFHFPYPVFNRFTDETAVARGIPKRLM